MSRGVISMRSLGRNGRFSNQLVQYAFLKTYAKEHDLEVQVPRWIGNYLFGCRDARIRSELPGFVELHDKDPSKMMIPRLAEPLRNVDLKGFFQYPSRYYAPHKDYIRSLFVPVPRIASKLEQAVARLRDRGNTLVGLHVRRGDYGYEFFYITPTEWYVSWLEFIWDTLDRPVLFVASDEPDKVLPALSRYNPVTAQELNIRNHRTPYYPDFYMLSQMDVLAIPNSTFSFVAAMLNSNLKQAFRSHLSDPLEDPPFRPFNPWDSDFIDCGAHVDRFPNIEGITRTWRVPRPPKWKRFLRKMGVG